jgi:release factor glutamine methyltransferase
MGEVAAPRDALTLRKAFAAAARLLQQGGIETPKLDARLLLCDAAGMSQEAYVARPDCELAPGAAERFGASIERRLAGEPVSRIIGVREFFSRAFCIDQGALDPRADTETLIEAALTIVESNCWRERPLKLLDLGTGTGCILLTLLAELPHASGVGTDASLAALAVARVNARRLEVDSRASFVAGDWLEPIGGDFDLVVANPPYVATSEIVHLAREVKDHDPPIALDGGSDGLEAYRRIAARLAHVLRPGGTVLLETGAAQTGAVLSLLRGAGLTMEAQPCLWHDLAGRPRCVVASARPRGAPSHT